MQKVTLFSQHNPENLLHKWPYQLLWLELYAISLKNSITPKWKISLKHCYAIFIWVVSHTRLLVQLRTITYNKYKILRKFKKFREPKTSIVKLSTIYTNSVYWLNNFFYCISSDLILRPTGYYFIISICKIILLWICTQWLATRIS